jgi:hypothetical protein
MSQDAQKVHCCYVSPDGRPCRARAVHGSVPPRCSAHAGRTPGAGEQAKEEERRTPGFYSSALLPEELADLVACADDLSLDDEIATTRVTLRRILGLICADHLQKQPEGDTIHLTTQEYARLATLALAGARTVARLLRDQRALSGEAADGIAGAIAQALDELGTELGLDL